MRDRNLAETHPTLIADDRNIDEADRMPAGLEIRSSSLSLNIQNLTNKIKRGIAFAALSPQGEI